MQRWCDTENRCLYGKDKWAGGLEGTGAMMNVLPRHVRIDKERHNNGTVKVGNALRK